MSVGLTNLDETVLNLGSGGSVPGKNTWSWGLYMYPLNSYIRKVHNNVYTDTSATKVSNGDVIGIAYDAGAGKMWASKNNTWMDSGDPAAGTNALFTNLSGTIAPAVQPPGGGVSTTNTANFGQRDFAYTPPTGFKALNTANLPAPTVKDGSKNFNTVTYSGVSGDNAVTGVGFQPDLVWIKSRSTTGADHELTDVVRGVTKALQSNTQGSEDTFTEGLQSFDTDGFTVGDDHGNYNRVGRTYVAWNWLEGATQGFDIITGTGGTAVNHNLGVAPDFVIFKYRNATSDWNVYHKDATSTSQRLKLNSQDGVESISTSWTINSTNFAYGGGSNTWVAYLFSEVEGYSKFGTYSGNGSTDGPFIYTGFKPAWLMVKKDAGSTDWKIYDAGRENYNVMSARLAANTSAAELSGNAQEIDFVSNGFKFRGTNGDQNSSGTFYYAAFASSPFGGSGVSPATAR